jgi:hypothetical protein
MSVPLPHVWCTWLLELVWQCLGNRRLPTQGAASQRSLPRMMSLSHLCADVTCRWHRRTQLSSGSGALKANLKALSQSVSSQVWLDDMLSLSWRCSVVASLTSNAFGL